MNYKIELNTYFKYDYTGLTNHLEKMALKGWELTRIGTFLHYKKVIPQKLHYAITYFPFSGYYEPESEEEQTFNDFCEMAGWEEIASVKSLKVFVNRKENPKPLETDPEILVSNINRDSLSELGTAGILVIYGLIGLIWGINQFVTAPLSFLGSNKKLLIFCLVPLLLLAFAPSLICYAKWYRTAKQEAKEGQFTATRYLPIFTKIAIFLFTVILILFFLSGYSVAGYVLLFTIAYLAAEWITDILRTKLRTRRINGAVNYSLSVVVLLIVVLPIMIRQINGEDPTYSYRIHFDTRIVDSTEQMSPSYVDLSQRDDRTNLYGGESLLFSFLIVQQDNALISWGNEEDPDPEKDDYVYTIVKEKNGLFHDYILSSLYQENDDSYDLPINQVIETEDRMIRLQFAEDPTEEDLTRIVDLLRNI